MSHTCSIKGIKIQSITALASALAELTQKGIKTCLITNATPRAFYKDQKGMGVADYVIKVEDCPYDVGLYKQPDNSYEPRTDFWAGYIEKIFGAKTADKTKYEQAKLGKLFQAYGLAAATETARKQGKTVRRVEGADGLVKLVISGY